MKSFLQLLKTGFATFSMFFGAGNILFPLALGQSTQDQSLFAVTGLLLTAVAIPISGLVAMTWYDGDYQRFFARLGRIPGLLVALTIMLLLGPLGSTPRCIALSFATMKVSLPDLSAPLFSAASCILIYLCAIRRRRIMNMLGAILTPLLLATLGLIIVNGVINAPEPDNSTLTAASAFHLGLMEGYYTMDLLAAFFFSSVIICGVRRDLIEQDPSPQHIRRRTIQAGLIGGLLLSIVYFAFCYIAAHHTSHMEGLTPDRLLGALTLHILGPSAGIVGSLTVALTCLTTAIALMAVFAEFLSSYVLNGKITYQTALISSLVITFFVSIMELVGIMAFLEPVLEVIYPVLIVLTIYNMISRPTSEPAVETVPVEG